MTKIPYFESFIRFQQSSGHDSTQLPTHDDIPFFGIINDGVQKGFRQFFRRMPTNLNDYHTLCNTLDFLRVDVTSDHNLHDIMADFRRGKSDWDPEERFKISGIKSLARDSAFRLLYQLLLSDFQSDVKDSNMAYQATLFVVSHRGIFKYRTRKMVREAFEERICVSAKQLQALGKWSIDPPTPETLQAGEMTTEPEDVDFDSDWSIW